VCISYLVPYIHAYLNTLDFIICLYSVAKQTDPNNDITREKIPPRHQCETNSLAFYMSINPLAFLTSTTLH
jgi:hypothetical protein